MGLEQRFSGVAQQIDDRNLNLHRIAFDPGRAVLVLEGRAVDRDSGTTSPRARVKQGALADLPEVEALVFRLDVAQQRPHLFDGEHDAIGFVANALELLSPATGECAEVHVVGLLDQELAVEQQDAERLIDFMGHRRGLQAASQLVLQQRQGLGITEALPLAGLRQAGLPFPQFTRQTVVAIDEFPKRSVQGDQLGTGLFGHAAVELQGLRLQALGGRLELLAEFLGGALELPEGLQQGTDLPVGEGRCPGQGGP